MLGHPGPEGPEQRPPVGRRRRRHRLRDHALLAEKPEEPGGGCKGLLVRSTGMSHARLFRERDLARLEPVGQIVCGEPCSAQPIGPPGKRSERMIDTDRSVSSLAEPSGKAIDVGGGRASAEPLSSDRRVQMSFEHRDLPSVRVVRIGPPFCGPISCRRYTSWPTTPTAPWLTRGVLWRGRACDQTSRSSDYTVSTDVAQDRWQEESGRWNGVPPRDNAARRTAEVQIRSKPWAYDCAYSRAPHNLGYAENYIPQSLTVPGK